MSENQPPRTPESDPRKEIERLVAEAERLNAEAETMTGDTARTREKAASLLNAAERLQVELRQQAKMDKDAQ